MTNQEIQQQIDWLNSAYDGDPDSTIIYEIATTMRDMLKVVEAASCIASFDNEDDFRDESFSDDWYRLRDAISFLRNDSS